MSYVTPTAEQLKRLTRWRVSTFWVMLLGYIGYYLVRGNLPVAIPLISKEFNYSNIELGIILTISEVAYALGKFIMGPLADRVGGKKIFLVGMAGAILFNVIFPNVRGIFLFALVWSCCRLFLSMGWGGIIKTIGEWYEAERTGTIMGVISINFQFGSVLASLFCGWLISLGVGWQGLFYIPAAVVSGVFIWSWLASKDGPHTLYPNIKFGRYASQRRAVAEIGKADDETEPVIEIVKGLLRLRIFRDILVFSFFSHFLRSVFLFWTPKFLVDLGMSAAAAAMNSAVFPFMGCLGTIFIGWYTDRYAKNGDRARMMWMMLTGLAICFAIVAILVPYGLEHQYWVVTFLGLGGFCLYGPYSMSSGALTLDVAGAKRAGSSTGMIDGIGYIGGALAAWVTGYYSTTLGWSEVYFGLGIVSLFGVWSAWRISQTIQRSST